MRAKPPLPAIEGLLVKPTVVNNVLTLASVSSILADGGAEYARHGVDRSKGTMPLQLAGNIKNGGLIEVPFGVSLNKVINEWGGGTRSGVQSVRYKWAAPRCLPVQRSAGCAPDLRGSGRAWWDARTRRYCCF